MANRYVRSGAGGAGTGADWANAFTTLTLACAADTAGDVFYVAHDHAESTAGAVTLNIAGTTGTPSYIYCVNSGGSVPPVAADLATTGTVTTTTTTSTITINGAAYIYGLTFSAGTGATGGGFVVSNDVNGYQTFQNCVFVFGTTGTVTFQTGATANNTFAAFISSTVTFSAVAQTFSIFGPTTLRNSTINGSAIPTNVFAIQIQSTRLTLEGCDLSAIGSGKSLIHSTLTNRSSVLLKDCKLGASVTIAGAASNIFAGMVLDLVNCDSGDTNYRAERYTRFGTLTTETTIVRTGGASDGTTPIAWKVVTSAEAEQIFPFECPPIAIWNETTGSAVTATIEGTWGGGSVPDTNDLWIEAQYLGTSGFPIASRVTSGVATPLHTASSYTTSSETWGGGTSEFKMSVTFTPQEKGLVYIYVKAALASSTFYLDPKITLS